MPTIGLSRSIDHNNQRYYESLDNLTPADVYNDRRLQYLSIKDMVNRKL